MSEVLIQNFPGVGDMLLVEHDGEYQVWIRDGNVWTDARNVYADVTAVKLT